MSGIGDYSTDPNSNGTINGINIAELCPAANLNNAERQLMADIAVFRDGGATSAQADATKMWGGTNTQIVTPKTVDDANLWIALTDGTTITPDLATGRNFTVTLGGSRTLALPTNLRPGTGGTIEVTQDATGNRSLSVTNTAWVFPGKPSSVPLSTAAGAIDLISYIVRSNSKVYATCTRFG